MGFDSESPMIIRDAAWQSFKHRLWDEAPKSSLVFIASVATFLLTRVVPKSAWNRLGEILVLQPHRFFEMELKLVPKWLLVTSILVAVFIAVRMRRTLTERVQLLTQERDSLRTQVEGHVENYRKREQELQQQLQEAQSPPLKLEPEFTVFWEIDFKQRRVATPPLCPKAECLNKKQRLAFSHSSNGSAVYRCPGCSMYPIAIKDAAGRGLMEREAVQLLKKRYFE